MPEPRIEEVAWLGFGKCSPKIAASDSLTFFNLKMLDGRRIHHLTVLVASMDLGW